MEEGKIRAGSYDLSDGGLLFAGEERKGPLTPHVSWRSQKADKESGKAGVVV